MLNANQPAIWFPTIKANTGVDSFTIRLVDELRQQGFRAEITWLPHHAEYLPWLISDIKPPEWANIIHINSWLHPRFYQSFQLPVLVTCHGCVHDTALTPYKSLAQKIYHQIWVKWLEKNAFLHSTKITAVSNYTAIMTKKAFGEFNIETIPNWLPDDAFVKFKNRDHPHHPFKLIYLGRLSSRKGTDLLPLIMQHLGSDFELHYTQHLDDRHFFSEVPFNMKALNWGTTTEQIKIWLDQADALVFPSRMEGMPLAVLEAMARGLPIICSDSASLPELVKNNFNGFLCSNENINEYITAIKYIKNNRNIWKEMSKNSYNYSYNRFGSYQSINKYINIYNNLIH